MLADHWLCGGRPGCIGNECDGWRQATHTNATTQPHDTTADHTTHNARGTTIMIIIARTCISYALAALIFALLWWLLTPANAHATGKSLVEQISYPTVAAVFGAILLIAKTIEQLLVKARLLRSEHEKQIEQIHDWFFDQRRAGTRMIEELHKWHKPVETPTGSRFTWRDSGEHAAAERATMQRIEEVALSIGKQVLSIAHSQDLILERMDQAEREKHT